MPTTTYHTQWAAQHFAAAELNRRGFIVAMTLGNARGVDLLVESPKGKKFAVEVKGMKTENWWVVSAPKSSTELIYILVYVPFDKPESPCAPSYFVMTAREVSDARDEAQKAELKRRGKFTEAFSGFGWKAAKVHQNRWDKLPA